MDPALEQPLLERLSTLLGTAVACTESPADLHARELVGGVVAVRGDWWGVVIVRCDRELALRTAASSVLPASTDALMRRFAGELTRVVRDRLDPTATMSEPVVLAADNSMWQPTSAWLQARVEARMDEDVIVVEIYRRRRSGEVEAVTSSDDSAALP